MIPRYQKCKVCKQVSVLLDNIVVEDNCYCEDNIVEPVLIDKQKLLDWIDELKIKAPNPMEGQKWYDSALQDVEDAIKRDLFDK